MDSLCLVIVHAFDALFGEVETFPFPQNFGFLNWTSLDVLEGLRRGWPLPSLVETSCWTCFHLSLVRVSMFELVSSFWKV